MGSTGVTKRDGTRLSKPVSEREIASLLQMLSRQGRAEDLRELISDYRNEIRFLINKTDNSKLAALHYAARNEAIDCVRILIEEGGADVNVKTDELTTPLHFAARYRRQSNVPTMDFIGVTQIRKKNRKNESTDIGRPHGSTSTEGLASKLSAAADDSTDLSPAVPFSSHKSFGIMGKTGVIHDQVIHYLVERGAELNGQDANGWTALHYAAIRGNQVATRQLLQEPEIDVEIEDHDGMRPIHLATSHNEIEIVRCLLTAAVNLFSVTQQGCLPIHFACSTGNVILAKLMLKHCGSPEDRALIVNWPNRNRETPLHWAVVNNHEAMVRFCLENNADPNLTSLTGETSLHMAARVGSVNIVRLLIEVVDNVDVGDGELQTALHKAAERNNVEVLELLLDKGSNAENEDGNACTALLLAVSKGHVEAVKLLIDRNVNLFAHDKSTRNIVYICAEQNRLDVLKLILSYAAATPLINVPNIYGNTPLHVAAKLGFVEIVKLLLNYGANQLAKNERERLAFHYAAQYGRLQIAELLLRKSPGIVSELDEDGNSAIHLAAGKGHQHITELLLNYGAAVDSRNSMRCTPLDCAAANGHRACAEFLLENDSPVDPRDISNTTPLHLACKHGHDQLVELLLEWGADPGVRMVVNENVPNCGPNALDIAIDHGNKSCSLIILRSAHWKQALCNQTIGESGTIVTPMRKLIMKMPDLAEVAMSRCITTNAQDRVEDGSGSEVYDFQFLEDTYAQWSREAVDHAHEVQRSTNPIKRIIQCCTSNNSASTSDGNGAKFGPPSYEADEKSKENDRPYTPNSSVVKKNHPLMLMVKYNRAQLLEHKLVRMQLKHKWARTGIVYYANLIMYIIFLAFYSVYMLDARSADLILRQSSSLENYTVLEACSKNMLDNSQVNVPNVMVAKYVVLSFAIFSLVKELFQLLFTGVRYFNLENTLEFSLFVLSILSVIESDPCLIATGLKPNWQWQCGAAGIFLAWLNLLLFVRQVPSLGLFVLMFTVIIETFARFFAVFFLFVLAFAFGFHILLSNHNQFNSLQNSLLKTSVMSLGELEFDSLFNAQFSSTEYSDSIYFGGITYSLFVFFLIVMTLVIMNLLVGLAVDDIKGVQNQAVVKRLAMQIQLLLDIDSLLPHWIRRRMGTQNITVQPSNGTNCSAFNLPRSLRLICYRLNANITQSEDEAFVDESAAVEQRLNGLDERLNEVQTDQKSIISTLNQLTVILRDLQSQATSPTDSANPEVIGR